MRCSSGSSRIRRSTSGGACSRWPARSPPGIRPPDGSRDARPEWAFRRRSPIRDNGHSRPPDRCPSAAAGPGGRMPDPTDLSVQLYTVRAALDADVDGTLAAVAGIGFRLVEPFELLERAAGLAGRLAAHGLSAPTAHADLLTADPAAVFAAARTLGIRTVIQPWVDPARWQTADEIE